MMPHNHSFGMERTFYEKEFRRYTRFFWGGEGFVGRQGGVWDWVISHRL